MADGRSARSERWVRRKDECLCSPNSDEDFLDLPRDFDAIQDEIERQKLVLLERTKPKETADVTGKDRRVEVQGTTSSSFLSCVDDRAGETRGAQMTESKISSTKLKGAKAMRVERLLRKMDERSKRRQARKDEVHIEHSYSPKSSSHPLVLVGGSLRQESTRWIR